jgi:hypothetical protein
LVILSRRRTQYGSFEDVAFSTSQKKKKNFISYDFKVFNPFKDLTQLSPIEFVYYSMGADFDEKFQYTIWQGID